MLADAGVRVIVLWGQHDVGKSRLALEATRTRQDSVVVATAPLEFSPAELRALPGADRETICVLEDPAREDVETLIREALAEPKLKLILTVPAFAHTVVPSYGADTRVRLLQVEPLPESESRRLIEQVDPLLPFGLAEWIVRRSAGLPGPILAAAALGGKLYAGAPDFEVAVGREYATRIASLLGPSALNAASLVSVMTQTGVAGEAARELQRLCEILQTPQAEVTNELDRLVDAGFLRRRGSYVEVSIPFLANHLASQLVASHESELLALLALPSGAGLRFLRRVGGLAPSCAHGLWDLLFSDGGLFHGRHLLDSVSHLKAVAGALPERTLSALRAVLTGLSFEELRRIDRRVRVELVFLLEQPLFRKSTSAEALRLIGLLANAEDVRDSKHASGVFAECFATEHPQFPLPLEDRLQVLCEFADSADPRRRQLACSAVEEGMPGNRGMIRLRSSDGARPFDPQPVMTYAELWAYAQSLMEVAWRMAEGSDDASAGARRALPGLTRRLGLYCRPRLCVPWFKRLVDGAVQEHPTVEIAPIADAIDAVVRGVLDALAREALPAEGREELVADQDALATLAGRLKSASFSVRLRRRLGSDAWTGDDPAADQELKALADEAVARPELMTAELWEWLPSMVIHHAPGFVRLVGKRDTNRVLCDRVESVGAASDGAYLFSSYWLGWVEVDPVAAEKRLDELAANDLVDGRAVVGATCTLPASSAAVDRLIGQVGRGRADAEYVARSIECHRWMEPLAPCDAERLFRVIAGEGLREGRLVVELLGMWLHLHKALGPELENLAWQTLEADPPVGGRAEEEWAFDQLAAHLAERDSNRAFQLLERLLGGDRQDKWSPVDNECKVEFWRKLKSVDADRAIGILLRAAENGSVHSWLLRRAMQHLLDPVQDSAILLGHAQRTVAVARMLAEGVAFESAGFWAFASAVTDLYPEDDSLWHGIATHLEGWTGVREGSLSAFLEERCLQVREAIRARSLSPVLRRRLDGWLERVEVRIGEHLVWEYDEDIDGLMGHIHQKDSQRIWAIGRILKHARFDEVRKLLTVEDIEEALPQVDLPKKRRELLEAALPIWKNAG
ncbi:MAG: hypothetical protein HYZ53_28865 [Planctomycetes bacterium]|nr:hypothetical protein [Planctomycetota bacterium]